MQNVFAYYQCRLANQQLALDLITEEFAPDLNSMEVQDKKVLEANARAASELFQQSLAEEAVTATNGYSEEQIIAARNAMDYYNDRLGKDARHLKKQMVHEAEGLAERYLWFVLLLPELVAFGRREQERRLEAGRAAKINDQNWLNNQVIAKIASNKPLQTSAIKHGLNWDEEEDFIRQFYKEVLLKDETILAYLDKSKPGFEEDRELVRYVVKKLLFGHSMVQGLMEGKDLYWAENQAILRSMMQRTLKAMDAEADDQTPLPELSYNWDDDKRYFIELYDLSIANEPEYIGFISEKSKNWNIERVAMLDKVILVMALAEMINFPSIPVKVTINEYIELSKKYSTPKSKIFVNGLLDVLSNELIQKGVIRKSGRGLIDNK